MDKAEYRIKLEQINNLAENGDFKGAATIADTIEWKKVRSVRTLCMIGEIYEANRRYSDSEQILKYAYRQSSSSKTVLYRLTEIEIRMGFYDEAKRYYQEFEELSPHDTSRYILKYKLLRAQGAPLTEQIEVLREYKEREYTERWAFELARLYKKNGQKQRCIEECDDMILWFAEGKYVTRAMELKMQLEPLSEAQQKRYDNRHKAAIEAERRAIPDDDLNGFDRVQRAINRADEEDYELRPERQKKVTAAEAIQKMNAAADEAVTTAIFEEKTPNVRPGIRTGRAVGRSSDIQDQIASSFREAVSSIRKPRQLDYTDLYSEEEEPGEDFDESYEESAEDRGNAELEALFAETGSMFAKELADTFGVRSGSSVVVEESDESQEAETSEVPESAPEEEKAEEAASSDVTEDVSDGTSAAAEAEEAAVEEEPAEVEEAVEAEEAAAAKDDSEVEEAVETEEAAGEEAVFEEEPAEAEESVTAAEAEEEAAGAENDTDAPEASEEVIEEVSEVSAEDARCEENVENQAEAVEEAESEEPEITETEFAEAAEEAAGAYSTEERSDSPAYDITDPEIEGSVANPEDALEPVDPSEAVGMIEEIDRSLVEGADEDFDLGSLTDDEDAQETSEVTEETADEESEAETEEAEEAVETIEEAAEEEPEAETEEAEEAAESIEETAEEESEAETEEAEEATETIEEAAEEEPEAETEEAEEAAETIEETADEEPEAETEEAEEAAETIEEAAEEEPEAETEEAEESASSEDAETLPESVEENVADDEETVLYRTKALNVEEIVEPSEGIEETEKAEDTEEITSGDSDEADIPCEKRSLIEEENFESESIDSQEAEADDEEAYEPYDLEAEAEALRAFGETFSEIEREAAEISKNAAELEPVHSSGEIGEEIAPVIYDSETAAEEAAVREELKAEAEEAEAEEPEEVEAEGEESEEAAAEEAEAEESEEAAAEEAEAEKPEEAVVEAAEAEESEEAAAEEAEVEEPEEAVVEAAKAEESEEATAEEAEVEETEEAAAEVEEPEETAVEAEESEEAAAEETEAEESEEVAAEAADALQEESADEEMSALETEAAENKPYVRKIRPVTEESVAQEIAEGTEDVLEETVPEAVWASLSRRMASAVERMSTRTAPTMTWDNAMDSYDEADLKSTIEPEEESHPAEQASEAETEMTEKTETTDGTVEEISEAVEENAEEAPEAVAETTEEAVEEAAVEEIAEEIPKAAAETAEETVETEAVEETAEEAVEEEAAEEIAEETLEAAAETAEEAVEEEAAEIAEEAPEAAVETAEEAVETEAVEETVEEAVEEIAEETPEAVEETAEEAVEEEAAEEIVEEAPEAAAVIAEEAIETEAAEETIEELADDPEEIKDLTEKPAVAVEETMSEAEEAVLAAEAEKAAETAGENVDEAEEAVQAVPEASELSAEEILKSMEIPTAGVDPEDLWKPVVSPEETETLLGRETDESLGLTREFNFQEELRKARAGDITLEEAAKLVYEKAEAEADSTREGKTEHTAFFLSPEEEARKTVMEAAGKEFPVAEPEEENVTPVPAEPVAATEETEEPEEPKISIKKESPKIPVEEIPKEIFADESDEARPDEAAEDMSDILSAEESEFGRDTNIIEHIMAEPEMVDRVPVLPRKFDETERKIFSYFSNIPGMQEQITLALADIHNNSGDKTSRQGNVLIIGRQASGKTKLAEGLMLAVCKDLHIQAAKKAKIIATDLNKKDPAKIVKLLAGGFLLIEGAGSMYDETIEKLSKAMEFRTDGLVVILEDEKRDMRAMLNSHPELAEKFTSTIIVPVFTNDELVTFARTYARENGYKFDEMATLALYTMIGENQKDSEPMTVGMVKEIVDQAIEHSKSRRFGFRSRNQATPDGRILLREKDFS